MTNAVRPRFLRWLKENLPDAEGVCDVRLSPLAPSKAKRFPALWVKPGRDLERKSNPATMRQIVRAQLFVFVYVKPCEDPAIAVDEQMESVIAHLLAARQELAELEGGCISLESAAVAEDPDIAWRDNNAGGVIEIIYSGDQQ